ncbi:MAG: hypothetical protein EB084_25255 [Proteobacteria bacterium]|nr:hypothetical protein [Pseudomonadota bacterium]
MASPRLWRASAATVTLLLVVASTGFAHPPVLPRMPGYPAGEITNPRDGSVMVIVPGGTFIMGADDHQDDEKP